MGELPYYLKGLENPWNTKSLAPMCKGKRAQFEYSIELNTNIQEHALERSVSWKRIDYVLIFCNYYKFGIQHR